MVKNFFNVRIDDIEDLFNNEKYKNAYLHLLLPFVVKFFNKEFIIPENIKNKFIETLVGNILAYLLGNLMKKNNKKK